MTRTTFIIFACCVVLWICVSQFNHYLAPLHLSVFVGGLLVTFSALRLGFREGWWASILIGLLIDSSAAVSFGFHALVFAVVHVGVFNLRGRFPREETTFGLIVALLANLALFLIITVSLIHRSPAPFAMLPRLLVDLLASETLVFLAAPWFFALQEHALEICGVSLRREQRGLL
jgi:cell shape-determining protein MreD